MVAPENQSDQKSMTNFIQRWLGTKAGTPRVARQITLKYDPRGSVLRGPSGAGIVVAALWLVMAMFTALPSRAADTLNWETNRNRVSADIKSGKLIPDRNTVRE